MKSLAEEMWVVPLLGPSCDERPPHQKACVCS